MWYMGISGCSTAHCAFYCFGTMYQLSCLGYGRSLFQYVPEEFGQNVCKWWHTSLLKLYFQSISPEKAYHFISKQVIKCKLIQHTLPMRAFWTYTHVTRNRYLYFRSLLGVKRNTSCTLFPKSQRSLCINVIAWIVTQYISLTRYVEKISVSMQENECSRQCMIKT